jgi:putative phosphoribosyl transferase
VPQNYVDEQVNLQMREIERRLISFRGSKEHDSELKEKTVVLVDDGIATGATIISAAQWLKTKQSCKELVIAVPVAPRDAVDRLKQIIGNNDRVLVLFLLQVSSYKHRKSTNHIIYHYHLIRRSPMGFHFSF